MNEKKEKGIDLALSEILSTVQSRQPVRRVQDASDSLLTVITRLENKINGEPSPAIPYVKVSKKDLLFVLTELKKIVSTEIFVVKVCPMVHTDSNDPYKNSKVIRIFSLETDAKTFKETIDTRYLHPIIVEKHSVDFQVLRGERVFVVLQLSFKNSEYTKVLGFFKTQDEAVDFSTTLDLSDEHYVVSEGWEIH